MHIIKVLMQSEMIPKVPRCVGSATHGCGGLLGGVVLVAGFSIYFVDQERQQIRQSEERGVFHGCGGGQLLICEGTVCISYSVYEGTTMPEMIGWIPVISLTPLVSGPCLMS